MLDELKNKLLLQLDHTFKTFMGNIHQLDQQFSIDAIRFFNVGYLCYREAIATLKMPNQPDPVNDTTSPKEAA